MYVALKLKISKSTKIKLQNNLQRGKFRLQKNRNL